MQPPRRTGCGLQSARRRFDGATEPRSRKRRLPVPADRLRQTDARHAAEPTVSCLARRWYLAYLPRYRNSGVWQSGAWLDLRSCRIRRIYKVVAPSYAAPTNAVHMTVALFP